MNFIKPTPIQGMAIPIALEGKDILGTAQTGTGKTLAFSIPLINKLILDKNAYALVMCPTRELASQVMSAIKSIISDKINIQTALLIGGEAMQKQLLIREKKRAAARLEKKAGEFGTKKQAIMELNEAIEERRAQLIEEQKDMKKKYEPEAYERILAESSASSDE